MELLKKLRLLRRYAPRNDKNAFLCHCGRRDHEAKQSPALNVMFFNSPDVTNYSLDTKMSKW
jgi:hypothetical protein